MGSTRSVHDTPAMRQFRQFKQQHPDCVLFFRMGDFYETFYDDAKLANQVLGVTLTQRTKGIPMAGVPHHSVEGYLKRMIQAGYRVAVCDQVEEAALAKGIVKREVTRVITPGTLTDESLLDEGKENPLAAVVYHEDGRASVAWAELSTGAFHIMTVSTLELVDELARIAPSELLYPEPPNTSDLSGDPDSEPSPQSVDGVTLSNLPSTTPKKIRALMDAIGCTAAARAAWQFRQEEAVQVLCRQFGVVTLEGFGLSEDNPALQPASAVVHYLLETQAVASTDTDTSRRRLAHLQPPDQFSRSEHLVINLASLRSLEVERTLRSGEVAGSLLGVIQGCDTAMGKRMLRGWLCYPLRERQPIEQRQRVVRAMVDDERLLSELTSALDGIQDVQRIASRIAVGRATPRDIVALSGSVQPIELFMATLMDRPALAPYLDRLTSVAQSLLELADTIGRSCVETAPGHLREGGLIRDGYDESLDQYRALHHDSHTWLTEYQKQLIDETGIANLKVGFNKVFGYYIEVTASHRDRAPDHWSRKQTLKNAERYITPPLKEFEGKVLSARERAIAREQELFIQLCITAAKQMSCLHTYARVIAELDVLTCFAKRAVRHAYVQPVIVDEPVLDIQGGRHPVLDELLGRQFVPNDVVLGVGRTASVTIDPKPSVSQKGEACASDSHVSDQEHDSQSGDATPAPQEGFTDRSSQTAGVPPVTPPEGATLALITGPNMAGKSTYIRQTALITLLAHTGSFVPADRATIGLCDRIFTRIGASDELHAGRSTFMVEMTETANICHHATRSSLVILDEIGRGTSTLDGLSLAWAIAEHLAHRRCRALFATHYHELTRLSEWFQNVTNLNVTVREWQDQIVFLHRIVPGATDRSYGIHVARIAGLPQTVVQRAKALLSQLSVNTQVTDPRLTVATDAGPPPAPGGQLSLFTEYMNHPVIDHLDQLDLNHLTPIQAFEQLRKIQDMIKPGT